MLTEEGQQLHLVVVNDDNVSRSIRLVRRVAHESVSLVVRHTAC